LTETTATPTVFTDNERVRVTEWRFRPGEATGHHVHEYDYVVVPMTTGPLTIRDSDGEREAEIQPGQPYFRRAGVEHDVLNLTDGEIVFIEVETKEA
jgi:quercetin dioxygenase-like cupin family protein